MTDLEATAYHEAGHAVASFLLRRAFRYVSIEPEGGSLGQLHMKKLPESFNPDINSDMRTRSWIEREAMIDFAGDVAATHAGYEQGAGTGGDMSNAVGMILHEVGSAEEAEAYANWLYIRAKGMITFGHNWGAVEMLAAALLERVRGLAGAT